MNPRMLETKLCGYFDYEQLNYGNKQRKREEFE
jgi:hypothetical protein